MAKVKSVPEGIRSVTPALRVKDCSAAIAFWKKAFGAEEISRAADPSGKKVWHAALRIGDSVIYCNDEFPEMGGLAQPAELWLYGDDVDGRFKRAVDAGGKPAMPVADMFWGDRMGKVVDAWGIGWNLAQRTKELTPAEMKAASDAFVASMQQKK